MQQPFRRVFIAVGIWSLFFINSCSEDEKQPKCSFTFKDKRYVSNRVFCIDQEEDLSQYGFTGPGLTMEVNESWGILEVDERVNYIRLELSNDNLLSLYSPDGAVNIIRQQNTLSFDASLVANESGIAYRGDISGSCTCTEVH